MLGMPIPPVPEGYIWDGWYTEEGVEVVHGMTITADVVAYARFKQIADEYGSDDDDTGSSVSPSPDRPSSGGSSAPTYTPTIEKTEGSKVTVSDKTPERGDKLTILTDPDKGYGVGKVTVTDSRGNPVQVIDNGDSTYTYVQPGFQDVPKGSYYYDAVNWAVAEGITLGTSTDTFSPNTVCIRVQVVTFLWRATGSPEPKNSAMSCTDVSADAYYYKAVLWAVENGITMDTSATTFSSDNKCTRAQIEGAVKNRHRKTGADHSK